jgi:putative transposase
MPSRNTIKSYAEDQMWHIYNRGVDGKIIFNTARDYKVFLSLLKTCLSGNTKEPYQDECYEVQRLRRINLTGQVDLLAYCLMPSHFHLLAYQYSADGIQNLLKSITVAYVLYFNRANKRQGRLFQGTFKASEINSEAYWQHISRYIHLNPIDIKKDFRSYPYSSYKYYVTQQPPEWIKPSKILGCFADKKEYADFVDDYENYKNELSDLKHILANN